MEAYIYVPWYSPQFGKGVWYHPYVPVPVLLPSPPTSPPKMPIDIARTKTPLQALDTRNLPTITQAEIQNLNTENFLQKGKGKFFMLLSHCEDDIHKSLKYGIWTASIEGNRELNQKFIEGKGSEPVYLFFSVIGSGMFVGFAEMISSVNFNASFNGWYPDYSSMGYFGVRWIFVKDIPFKSVFRVRGHDGLSVAQYGDCEEIPKFAGFKLFRIFAETKKFKSVLEDFHYYDAKEETVRLSIIH